MPDPSTTEINARTVERFYLELWDESKRKLLVDLLAPGSALSCLYGCRDRGRDAFGRYIETIHTAFPDWRHSINELIAIDDRVITRMTWRGTHLGPLRDLAPTGARVEYVGGGLLHPIRRHRRRGLGGWRHPGGVAGDGHALHIACMGCRDWSLTYLDREGLSPP